MSISVVYCFALASTLNCVCAYIMCEHMCVCVRVCVCICAYDCGNWLQLKYLLIHISTYPQMRMHTYDETVNVGGSIGSSAPHDGTSSQS